MNILFITPDFYPNSTGFANASLNLINVIKEYGKEKFNIFVFTTIALGEDEEIAEINIYRYTNKFLIRRPTRFLHEWIKFKKVKQYIEDNKIDIIFMETNTFPYFQNYLIKEYGDRIIVRIHSTMDTEIPIYKKPRNFNEKKQYQLMKSFLKETYNIVSTSNYYLDFVKTKYFEDNVFTMWDNKSYGLLYNTAGLIESTQNNKVSSNTFLTLGKMSGPGITQKGITDVLKAVYYLKEEKKLPDDFKLYIVGNGERREYIHNLVSELNLNNCVELIVSLPHNGVLELVSKVKSVILLSRYEGQSMFITETLALGKPILLSDGNGMKDMIIEGYNGFLVKTGDARDAASVLYKFMNLKEEDIEKMGANSKKLYQEKYTPEAIYKQFEDVIRLRSKGNKQ